MRVRQTRGHVLAIGRVGDGSSRSGVFGVGKHIGLERMVLQPAHHDTMYGAVSARTGVDVVVGAGHAGEEDGPAKEEKACEG